MNREKKKERKKYASLNTPSRIFFFCLDFKYDDNNDNGNKRCPHLLKLPPQGDCAGASRAHLSQFYCSGLRKKKKRNTRWLIKFTPSYVIYSNLLLQFNFTDWVKNCRRRWRTLGDFVMIRYANYKKKRKIVGGERWESNKEIDARRFYDQKKIFCSTIRARKRSAHMSCATWNKYCKLRRKQRKIQTMQNFFFFLISF